MRVAVAYPGCHRRGGVERVMLETVNFLAGRGHETHAFARDWDPAHVAQDVVRHDLRVPALIPAMEVPMFRRRLSRELGRMTPRPDVIAGFGATAPDGAVTWMTSVHAAWIETARRLRGPMGRLRQRVNPFHPVILGLERRLLEQRRYGALIALTPQVKADMVRLYQVPEDEVEVIPNGYSRREFPLVTPEGRRTARDSLGFRDDDKVLMFVANELDRKGFDPLLDAIRVMGDPSIRLLAVGGFDHRAARSSLKRAGLAGRARLVGSTDNVAGYYAAADLFVLPTRYEAWGLVILEALASGLPVVTSRDAGAAIAVRHGETGVLLGDPGDAKEIARGIVQAISLSASAQDIANSVASYEWSRLLARYEQVLAHHATRP